MKISILILIIIGFISCSKNNHENELHEQLIGNWKTDFFKTYTKETAFIFSFRDSTCSYLLPYGEFSEYWISGDTLMIKEKIYHGRYEDLGGELTFKFLIDSISPEHLTLKPITTETNQLLGYSADGGQGIINLTKVKVSFDWQPERIAYYSSLCYGVCPGMYLEIDSAGNFYFIGGSFTEKNGNYSGTLSPDIFNRVVSEINCIEFDSLKQYYEASWTDDQTCGVLIQTKDTIYKSSAYGFDEEPVELRILFHTLMELYKDVELKEDSLIEDKFLFQNFPYENIPPPPYRK